MGPRDGIERAAPRPIARGKAVVSESVSRRRGTLTLMNT